MSRKPQFANWTTFCWTDGFPFPKKPSRLAAGPLYLVEVNATTLWKCVNVSKAVVVPSDQTFEMGCGVLILRPTADLQIIDAHIVLAAAHAAFLGFLSPEQVAEVLRQVHGRQSAEADGGFSE